MRRLPSCKVLRTFGLSEVVQAHLIPTYTHNWPLMRVHSFALGLSVRANFVNADLEVDTVTILRLETPGENAHCCPNFQPRGSPPVARKRVRRSNLEEGRRPRCLCPGLRRWCWSLCQRTTSRPTQVTEGVRTGWWWKARYAARDFGARDSS